MEKKKDYSEEEIDLILQGIRPEGMDFEEFRVLRIKSKKLLKGYLKGRLFHKSSWLERIPDTEFVYRKTETYIKSKEDGK